MNRCKKKNLVDTDSVSIGAATLISPLELIRTKMQSERLTYRQLREALRVSVRNNGPLFLMRGLGPSLLHDVPFSGTVSFSIFTGFMCALYPHQISAYILEIRLAGGFCVDSHGQC